MAFAQTKNSQAILNFLLYNTPLIFWHTNVAPCNLGSRTRKLESHAPSIGVNILSHSA